MVIVSYYCPYLLFQVTTDGTDAECVTDFGLTSAAAPMVSGAIALALQAK